MRRLIALALVMLAVPVAAHDDESTRQAIERARQQAERARQEAERATEAAVRANADAERARQVRLGGLLQQYGAMDAEAATAEAERLRRAARAEVPEGTQSGWRFFKEPYREQQAITARAYPPAALDSHNDAARILEQEGKGPQAVALYAAAARQGSAAAATRLAEIYARGIPGVARDPDAAREWRTIARFIPEDVPLPRR